MSAAEPAVGATSGSSSAAVPPPAQQRQEISAVQFMSAAEPAVGDTSGSSSAAVPPPAQQQQEISAVQFSDAIILEILRRQQQQQEIIAAQFSDAFREFIKQQQQETTAAARSRSEELRGWLMFIVTITASITYSAALNPPGGFWQDDDPTKGHIAGRPVLLEKIPRQYNVFFYCNLMSFATSLCIIVQLSTPWFYNRIPWSYLSYLVAVDILAWAVAFIAGSSTTLPLFAYEAALVLVILAYMVCHMFLHAFSPRHVQRPCSP